MAVPILLGRIGLAIIIGTGMTLLLRERTRSLIDQLEAEHDWNAGTVPGARLTSPVAFVGIGTRVSRFSWSTIKVHGAVDRATDSNGFEYAARVGYGTSGVLPDHRLHRAATGVRFRRQRRSVRALATLAAQPGGAVALWITAVGLFALALWRLAEAVVGSHPNEPGRGDDGIRKFKRLGRSASPWCTSVSR